MPRTNLPHIIVSNKKDAKPYQSVGRGGGNRNRPTINNKSTHVQSLIRRFDRAYHAAQREREARLAETLPARDGVYIRIRSFAGHRLSYSKMELKSANIRVLHFTQSGEGDERTEEAILFIPFGSVQRFLTRLEDYRRDVEQGKMDNASQKDLIEYIASIEAAVFDQFWQDPDDKKPAQDAVWTEVWIWTDDLTTDEGRSERLIGVRDICRRLQMDVKEESLHFAERSVMMVYANEDELTELLKSSDYISEFRLAKSAVQFFADLEPADQHEACQNLLDRIEIDDRADEISITILDHGVNREHPLLNPLLHSDDRHTINLDWGEGDDTGHGTEMAGLAIFGDLGAALGSTEPVYVGHVLESSKFLPPRGNNPKHLYGDFTKRAISLPTIQSSDRKRIVNMAVTADDDIDRGRPSSWSAAVDEICHTEDLIFMVSAGNNDSRDLWKLYPEGNLLAPVQDPGQSWNAITVGAYTQLSQLNDPDLQNHEVVAQNGQLSPYSATGDDFESQWPVKPEVVFEGGNLMRAPDGFISAGEDDLSVLTTSHEIDQRLFSTTWATSAATARASEFAARLQSAYPDFWPETIRGLMIHSAEWTEGMKDQFDELNIDLSKKSGYQKALKVFGYGVPSFQKARHSADNSLSLIAESEIQPFHKTPKGVKFNELHIYELPWPKEELIALAETEVKLKVTLSYYIEPMPGSRGNKDKYRYASHQLEFQICNPGESVDEFSLRMGEKLQDEDYSEARQRISHSEDRWIYGINSRNSGSIHSDCMKMTGAEMADCNLIAIYPKTGWWYTRNSQMKYNDETRYSLIIGLSTPEENVDLYTPVSAEIEMPIEIQTEL
ncbi:MAG: S8 family peptidase [Balneolaceae bacterium]|nr:S8 family peptidase [Balneolaceae bacterium]